MSYPSLFDSQLLYIYICMQVSSSNFDILLPLLVLYKELTGNGTSPIRQTVQALKHWDSHLI